MVAAAIVFILGQATAQSSAAVTFLTPEQLAAAHSTAPSRQAGTDAAELVKQPGYQVLQIRRTAPGGSEVHAEWADIWYVLRGHATLVTGGSMVEGATTEPGETRGKGVVNGESRELKGGELVVIPPGVPHWISKIQGEIVYLLVKAPKALPVTK